jgi:hypothetical protein
VHGVVTQGGISTGSRLDSCEIRAALREQPSQPYCRVKGATDAVKGRPAFTIPRIDVRVAGTFQSWSRRQAAVVYPAAVLLPALGRPFVRVPLRSLTIPTANEYGDRLNQLDFRIGKILRRPANGVERRPLQRFERERRADGEPFVAFRLR